MKGRSALRSLERSNEEGTWEQYAPLENNENNLKSIIK